jgi:hypothetical protein
LISRRGRRTPEPNLWDPTRPAFESVSAIEQAWLGHKNIQHTVRYTELAPDRIKDLLALNALRRFEAQTGKHSLGLNSTGL